MPRTCKLSLPADQNCRGEVSWIFWGRWWIEIFQKMFSFIAEILAPVSWRTLIVSLYIFASINGRWKGWALLSMMLAASFINWTKMSCIVFVRSIWEERLSIGALSRSLTILNGKDCWAPRRWRRRRRLFRVAVALGQVDWCRVCLQRRQTVLLLLSFSCSLFGDDLWFCSTDIALWKEVGLCLMAGELYQEVAEVKVVEELNSLVVFHARGK